MSEKMEQHAFQAEVQQLLELMVHSLYSNKEVFLRELISNASDALDKRRFEQLTNPELATSDELHIRLERDAEKRTLSVVDNGIGMSREELIQNIGTIAKSGTKEFLAALKESGQGKLPPDLIGQFGVGFYSAFMVAERVSVLSRRAGQQSATLWESKGDGTFSIGEAERAEAGTTVTLQLKPADEEGGLPDLCSEVVLRGIVKRYSDFVAYPIRMQTWRPGKDAADAKVLEDETLNSMKAIWDLPKDEVSETQYKEFYHHIAQDWSDPLRTIPIRIEGTLEAYALLYVPTQAPFDLYSAEMKRGLQLYVQRVFIMDECKELMPPHLRFIKGVVDSHDLSLNVSREMLQKDRRIQTIKNHLVKKVYATLGEMKQDSPDEYQSFWLQFGAVLKEGLFGDAQEQSTLLDLLVTPSTKQGAELTSLQAYVERMKEGQDAIYFLTGSSKEAVEKSPLLEAFIAKGYEVLLFSDPIDELWLERAPKYKDKPLKSIARGDVELGSDEERKTQAAELEEKQKELGDLLSQMRVALQDEIKEVRLSNRLTTSAACLVADEHDMSPRLQRMLEQMGQTPEKPKRILELNPAHELVTKLRSIVEADQSDPRVQLYAQLLLGQAHLAESGQVPDPSAFSKVLGEIMHHGLSSGA